jgi:hypothetical protein
LQIPEESARKLLAYFVGQLGYQAGHGMLDGHPLSFPMPRQEIFEGVRYAQEQRWIETTEDGEPRLTNLGVDEA